MGQSSAPGPGVHSDSTVTAKQQSGLRLQPGTLCEPVYVTYSSLTIALQVTNTRHKKGQVPPEVSSLGLSLK